MDDWWNTRTRLWSAVAAVGGLGLAVGLELIDEPDITLVELLLELLKSLPIVITCVGMVLLFQLTRRQRVEHLALLQGLDEARQQGERWRADSHLLLNGLSEAIDLQFRRWSLTEAERQVAMLLLKGLSSKEIAVMRQSSERTVREQARAVYAKAGLSGRAALSAYFLEDLLAPSAQGVR
ncbi:MAG TPA: helix-turn-helix transcriptional regulator [Ideonella sp.]|uniref:response regulator transcription factor n=1 Tax=Ideonella sp. TaxID=1929293 RepID=UPI002E30B763|nr:helix-turn-helix transcriptional regulator [Ideonella sp.]HEX5687410.1 helix-turn-helix transcriptional regulator [Ideonella sp.]